MTPLIITTDERFVIFGLVDDATRAALLDTGCDFGARYRLHSARIVINWRNQPEGAKGLAALASHGPQNCLLSPVAPSVTLSGASIRQVWCLSPEAEAAWSAAS